MQSPIYLDTARFGLILPECAEMLREFASLLEAEGQFPLFDLFLYQGSEHWPDRLKSRFPMIARWQGLSELKRSILSLTGVTSPSTVLLASASRHLARVAFQQLSLRCERVLCSDADWPEFQDMLRVQMAQCGGCLYSARLDDHRFPTENKGAREHQLARSFRNHECDGALITAVAAEGLTTNITSFLDLVSCSTAERNIIVDGSQQAGHIPIELGPRFSGCYLSGTHKWLRSGVPLSFGVFVHDGETTTCHRRIRNAIRLSLVDDPLLLQTSEVGLESPRQTMRLEPLIAGYIAITLALEQDVQKRLEIRKQNASQICEILTNLPLELSFCCSNGIVELRLDGSQISALEIQRHFAGEGIVLSVCGEQRLRISCPSAAFTDDEVEHVWRVFGGLADQYMSIQRDSLGSDGCHSVA